MTPRSDGLLEGVRRACARVAELAEFVRLDRAALERWVEVRAGSPPAPPSLDPAHHRVGDADTTLAFVLTLDAINFGSGWFPVLTKRSGLSGYLSIATALKEHFEREGPWSAAGLRRVTSSDCAAILGQRGNAAALPLMQLFARALVDLGVWLEARHGGCFRAAVAAAGESAEALARSLAEMPLYRDVSLYRGFEVPLYKRAQITASDLAEAFEGEGPGRFRDLERLTIFADNLVPHVLRREGVLVYAPELALRIDREELLPAGSPAEVEIRAVALHAVECALAALRARGVEICASALDHELWNRGQAPEIKAHPRHRTRSTYY